MNFYEISRRLKYAHNRDGYILFTVNIFFYYPIRLFSHYLRAKYAYRKFIKKEYASEELMKLHAIIEKSLHKPLLSILVPTYKSNLKYLKLAIDSIYRQTYTNWELCIVDDASHDPKLIEYLTAISKKDIRVKCQFSAINQHISTTSNQALEMCSGEFVVLLDHDDELSPYALAYIAREIIQNPNIKVIYSDEDKLDSNGSRHDPYFKCDWNYELFLGQNLISHLGAYNAKLVRELGGFRKGYEGSQDYDLALRSIEKVSPREIVHIPKVLYHWRVLPGSTALNINQKPYAIVAAEKALNDHLVRTNQKGKVSYFDYGYQIHYSNIKKVLKITVFIEASSSTELDQANKLAHHLLKINFIKDITILTSKPAPPSTNSKISFFSTASSHPKNMEQMTSLSSALRVILHHSGTRYKILMAADAEFKDDKWLTEMLNQIEKPDVAAVSNAGFNRLGQLICGPKIINRNGYAITPFQGLLENQVGYGGRNQLTQQLSALDTDCLLINTKLIKSKYFEFKHDDTNADFFIKLRSQDLKLIWTPLSKIHFTSLKRINKLDRHGEKALWRVTNSSIPFVDEFYNPNFSVNNYCFRID